MVQIAMVVEVVMVRAAVVVAGARVVLRMAMDTAAVCLLSIIV